VSRRFAAPTLTQRAIVYGGAAAGVLLLSLLLKKNSQVPRRPGDSH
jgi:hypothetical protein